MSTNASAGSESSSGSKGIYIALIPWIIFSVLVAHSTLKLGSILALAAAVVIAIPGIRSGRPKSLEIGAVVTFIGFVVVAFIADGAVAHWIARYARGIAALVLAGIAFGSLLFVPFTEQYAREKVPEQYWGSATFKAINRKLTALWGFVFIAMVPFHIIAGAVDTRPAKIICNWVIPLALVSWGIKQTSAITDSDKQPATLEKLA
ncbi:MAG TPA: hypothetical protein VMF57_00675 [Solirubrobacteraceae bacterium]|nr:hypothetical protein [Solirubrobacteraceae bacterium]